MIPVSKPFLPPLNEYQKLLQSVWEKRWLTNNGELVLQLEAELKNYLGVKHLFFCSNGTIAIQLALKSLNITREVITTPFSHVATTNAVLWEKCIPVFADIKPDTFCIDIEEIEKSITKNTQAILATHVFGFPCDVEKIENIAHKYNLKVIYDGAHTFGCSLNGKSLLSYGDIATCSFHATKIFHTGEGGCVITNDDEIAEKVRLFRQFGQETDEYYYAGINAKNSELHAAMGLGVLPYVKQLIESREKISEQYDSKLTALNLQRPVLNKDFKRNFSFHPVIFNSENDLLKAKNALEKNEIYPRRYFYPSLNLLFYLSDEMKKDCPISEDISKRVLCLPLYHDLSDSEVDLICETVLQSQKE